MGKYNHLVLFGDKDFGDRESFKSSGMQGQTVCGHAQVPRHIPHNKSNQTSTFPDYGPNSFQRPWLQWQRWQSRTYLDDAPYALFQKSPS